MPSDIRDTGMLTCVNYRVGTTLILRILRIVDLYLGARHSLECLCDVKRPRWKNSNMHISLVRRGVRHGDTNLDGEAAPVGPATKNSSRARYISRHSTR